VRLDVRFLRLAVVAGATLVVPLAGCGLNWELDYQRGLAKAADARRRAVVQFYQAVSRDCRAMDLEVFSNDDVRKLLGRFVPIRLDPVLSRQLAEQWEVQNVPAFVVLRPDGSVAGKHDGRMDAKAFCVFLINHMYN